MKRITVCVLLGISFSNQSLGQEDASQDYITHHDQKYERVETIRSYLDKFQNDSEILFAKKTEELLLVVFRTNDGRLVVHGQPLGDLDAIISVTAHQGSERLNCVGSALVRSTDQYFSPTLGNMTATIQRIHGSVFTPVEGEVRVSIYLEDQEVDLFELDWVGQ